MKKNERFVIGLDVGGTHIRGVLFEVSGQAVLASSIERLGDDKSPKTVCDLIQKTIATLCHNAEIHRNAIDAVGVGFAGWIDRLSGTVSLAPNLGWRNVAFAGMLVQKLSSLVFLFNDLSAVTYGEWRLGAARDCSDVLCVFVGSGLGGGLILDGKPYEGSKGYAAELGHITVVPGGEKCGCGASGCLEAYVGGRYLEAKLVRECAAGNLKTVLQAAGGRLDAITVASLETAVRIGDKESLDFIQVSARYLTLGLSTALKILNPSCVVLGGGVMTHLPTLFDETTSMMQAMTPQAFLEGLEIRRSLLGDQAGAVGAALLAQDRASR